MQDAVLRKYNWHCIPQKHFLFLKWLALVFYFLILKLRIEQQRHFLLFFELHQQLFGDLFLYLNHSGRYPCSQLHPPHL